jgi:outer membrane receptor protein involved in Fe transport
MVRNLLLTLSIFLMANVLVFSQSGAIKGKIVDNETGEPIPFANVILENGGTVEGGATSDFDGNYIIKPVSPGTYNLKATYIGYKSVLIRGMIINADQIRFFDIKMEATAETLEEIVVTDYRIPLINKDETVSGGHVTAEEIAKMPNRNANAIATSVGGVFSADGERGNVRGARNDQTIMYIDGIRVLGSASLPQSAIEQVSVYLGGLPAQYGDARGGIINVTTKGPSRAFGAGIELETSKFLDAYGQSRMGFNVQGPLIKGKKDEQTSLLGFFLSGDLSYQEDSRPTATGVYVADDSYLQSLQDNPLRPTGLTSGGTFLNGEFTRQSDLALQKANPNASRYGINLSGKIDVRTSKSTNLSFGGQYVRNDGRNWSFTNSMFNYDKNALTMNTSWRVFGRFTQRFPSNSESKSLVKNVYYTIQADYSELHTRNMDPYHKDDLFKYGYLGKYTTSKVATYELGDVVVDGQEYTNIWKLNSWDFDTAYVFQQGNYNKYIGNYTRQIYEFYPDKWGDYNTGGDGNWMNSDQLQLNGGLLNGQGPDAFYGMWSAPGSLQSNYGIGSSSQIAINASLAADIGNHELKFGFRYEQRVGRGYGYNGPALWTLMRGYTNFHILTLDIDNPIAIYQDGVFMDTVIYNRKYDAPRQTRFDKSLRRKLGLEEDGLDFILVDSYDMDNKTIQYYDKDGVMHSKQLSEDLYSVDMFSADELLFDGSFVANYNGYDYKGNKLTNITFDDFFTKKDENGDFLRPISAYEPIYMAGYIQDKFAFRDLIFNVGLRVDRFDANQNVLKDPFLLYPARTVSEVSTLDGQIIDHPGNMGEDYTVYVNDVKNPTKITGYRDGFVWYNDLGVEVQDPNALDASGVKPYLIDPDQKRVGPNSFKDYDPQISVMPRISFSFPISDEALFFAHYDVLTQRPTSNVFSNPAIYYFFDNVSGRISNPNLKPTKTIDYELGFQQKLTNKSSLRLTTFYREMRDDIQSYRFVGAYPKDYDSYNNIDFGTVKGLTVTYDLRRMNSNTRVNASYTLQFADGTGSSTTTAAALIAAGLPNLRSTNPLNWDRRHGFNISIDYRYGEGKNYNGPTITRKKGTDNEKVTQILKNTGVNFLINGGSGTPYTAQENIIAFNSGGTRLLKGTMNGSRLPWQFRIDMRLDKDFHPKWGDKKAYFNVYLQVLNLFNTKNIMGVYSATGNADDDGYLAAPEWQQQIENQLDPQSYRDLYALRVNVPFNYSSPRLIRIGVRFNF